MIDWYSEYSWTRNGSWFQDWIPRDKKYWKAGKPMIRKTTRDEVDYRCFLFDKDVVIEVETENELIEALGGMV